MPIPLDDLRWKSLTTAYSLSCDDVVAWLRASYTGGLTSDLLGNIINDIQHQGDTSQAMYAVAPHLLALAPLYPGALGRDLAIHAGLIVSSSQAASAISCPSEIVTEFEDCLEHGRHTILRYLADATEFEDFKYLVAALAGFSSHGRFGQILEGFDLFEGQFHHTSLDDPLPEP
jgi:hypothetical protein